MLYEKYTDEKGRSAYSQATRKGFVFISVVGEDGEESGAYLTPKQARSLASDLAFESKRAENAAKEGHDHA